MSAIIPALFIFVFVFAAFKKVNVFTSFTRGALEGLNFLLSLLPTLATIFMMCELFEVSGLATLIQTVLSPLFCALGIPQELCKLILIKPFSGSGSLTYLTNLIATYGADSYIARCACVVYGSSETLFYISAIYFAKTSHKKLFLSIALILLSTFISTVFGCFICKFV
jgi:spore maturation protein B